MWSTFSIGWICTAAARSRRGQRQADCERCAVALDALSLECAPILLDDQACRRQAEAQASGNRFGVARPIEGAEDVRQVRPGHADTIVRYAHYRIGRIDAERDHDLCACRT